MREPKYKAGETVYHVTKGSPIGIIIEIIYLYVLDEYYYDVAFSYNETLRCVERELTNKRKL